MRTSGGMRRDEVGGGIEPDAAIEGGLGAHETVDEGDERGASLLRFGAGITSREATSGASRRSRAESRSRMNASRMGSASW